MFYSSVSLKKDEKSETIVYKCLHNDCQFRSDVVTKARRHVRRHNKDRAFKCILCDKSFVLRAYLTQHLEYVHNSKGRPFISCGFTGCQFKTLTDRQLEIHYLTHSEDRPFKCQHSGCESSFKSNISLKQHMKKHIEVKAFVCPVPDCSLRFAHKIYLKKHMQTHNRTNNTNTKLKEVLQNGNFCSIVDTTKQFSGIFEQNL